MRKVEILYYKLKWKKAILIRDTSEYLFSPIVILFYKTIEVLIKTLMVAKTSRLWIKREKVAIDFGQNGMIFDDNE